MAPKLNGKNALQLRGKNLDATAPSNQYLYIYNSTTDKFEIRALTEADITNLTTDLSSKVTGISSATDGAVVLFDSTTGKLIKDSTFVLNNFVYGNTIYGGTLSTDLNSIIRNGFYTAYGTATGAPNTSYSWFITHINSNAGTVSAVQIATAFDGSDITYRRVKTSSTWGSWVGVPSLIQTAINTKLAGTGVGSAAGKVYIGKADGTFSLANLTAGTNITITNSDGSITIAAAGSSSGSASVRRYLEGELFPTVLMYYRINSSCTISEARATIGGLPTGQSIKVDVRKLDSGNTTNVSTASIFSSDTPIELLTSGTLTYGVYSLTGTLDSARTSCAPGDVILVVITQVGSTIAGNDLEVVITF